MKVFDLHAAGLAVLLSAVFSAGAAFAAENPSSERGPQIQAAREAGDKTDAEKNAQSPSDAELLGRIKRIEPPEDGFFSKELDCCGIPIKAHEVVDDMALVEAWRRIERQLRNQPKLIRRLNSHGSELQIIGKDQANTDLPEFRHLKGKPYDGDLTMDERCRGVGGLNASCGEENLLKLKEDRYFGRDICSHEFTHTMHMFGSSQKVQRLIHSVYMKSTREKGLWKGAYAGSNEFEYIAEMTMWYFGTVGDCGGFEKKPESGPEWLKQYDPDGYKLIDDFYSGRLEPLQDDEPEYGEKE